MVSWFRASNTPPDRPSDEEIQREIDSHDPKRRYVTRHPYWRSDMLERRDIFQGRLSRHASMPRISLRDYPNLLENPSSWTPQHSAVLATPQFSGSTLNFSDNHPGTLRVLYPLSRGSISPTIRLLGLDMLTGLVPPWGSSFKIRGVLQPTPGQVEWIRFTLQRDGALLKRAGIDKAILLSLFSYDRDASLFRAFFENWNYSSNTLFVQDREMTLNLWELYQLSGMPIFGLPYEEYIPQDTELFGMRHDGTWRYPASLRRLFQIYLELSEGQNGVTFDSWIAYFTDKAGVVSKVLTDFTDFVDPVGAGREKVEFSGPRPEISSLTSQDVDGETLLTAFLAWWICYYVIPADPEGMIRPETFVVANTLAQGLRISLAIPALANIYKTLRLVTSSRDPAQCDVIVPFHFLCGWLHMYWPGLYTPVISDKLLDKLPLLAQIAGAQPIHIDRVHARELFLLSQTRLRFSDLQHHQRVFSRNLPRSEMEVNDIRPFCQDTPKIFDQQTDAEFMLSIRRGLLPLRSKNNVTFEVYNPHRCAHQFGYDMMIPETTLPFNKLSGDLDSLATTWSLALRTGTESKFHILPARRIGRLSKLYLQWFHNSVAGYHVHHPKEIANLTCGKRSARGTKRERGASSSIVQHPPDFCGLDEQITYTERRDYEVLKSGQFPPTVVHLKLGYDKLRPLNAIDLLFADSDAISAPPSPQYLASISDTDPSDGESSRIRVSTSCIIAEKAVVDPPRRPQGANSSDGQGSRIRVHSPSRTVSEREVVNPPRRSSDIGAESADPSDGRSIRIRVQNPSHTISERAVVNPPRRSPGAHPSDGRRSRIRVQIPSWPVAEKAIVDPPQRSSIVEKPTLTSGLDASERLESKSMGQIPSSVLSEVAAIEPASSSPVRRFQPSSEGSPDPEWGTEKRPNGTPEQTSPKKEGSKRKRSKDLDAEEVQPEHLKQIKRITDTLERGTRLVAAQLEAQAIQLQMDRDQRKEQFDELLKTFNRLADGITKIAEKL